MTFALHHFGEIGMIRLLRIAVADDEPDMRQYFEKILPRLGHEVISVARDGLELVEHCLLHRPNLVITDVNMPRLDGVQAARRINEQLSTPIIFVTADSECPLAAPADFDCSARLLKPIRQADLEAAITGILRL